MQPFFAAAALLAAGAMWSVRMTIDPDPFSTGSGILIGLDLLALTAVAVTGLLLTRGLWSRRLAGLLVAAQAGLAVVTGFDVLGVVALAATALAAFLVAGPFPAGWLRALPPADAPPPRATLLALGLLAVPGVTGAAALAGPGPLHWALAAGAALTAWAYTRARTEGLWSARTVVPGLAAAAAPASPLAGGIAIAAAGAVLAALAWHGDARRAVTRLLPRPVGGVAVPPQLVPPEVLRAAGYDEQGRPRETG